MRIAFANCLLDTDARQVWCDGSVVRLSPKAYELLCLLAGSRPRVLSKDELYSQLWTDTFVVEANLPNLVSEIRAALGDSARRPRIIRTAHGFGYGFCADAQEEAGSPAPETAPCHWLIWHQREVPLRPGQHTVGRDPHASIRFDLPSVSRYHARITVTDEGVTLEDLGSKNGTTMDGRRLAAPVVLRDGDEIHFGSVHVTFRAWTEARPTVTLADA